jgi:DNA-directed RNA polymerase specialized sigma24 family protein
VDNAGTITEWVKRLRQGDPQAPEKLFACYAHRLIGLAERHLSRKMAGRIDGEDVVQSVFRTFFRRHARGEFRINSSDKIWRLLVRITLLKAKAKGRYHTAGLRDVRAEADGDVQEVQAVGRRVGAVVGEVGPAGVLGERRARLGGQAGAETLEAERAVGVLPDAVEAEVRRLLSNSQTSA